MMARESLVKVSGAEASVISESENCSEATRVVVPCFCSKNKFSAIAGWRWYTVRYFWWSYILVGCFLRWGKSWGHKIC